MKPIREKGGEKYLRAKKYYPFVGMGYVQITWEHNYERASRELCEKASTHMCVDFVGNPKLLLEPKYAAPIIIAGMVEGWFTGKKLSD
jgi:predicted chitinase